MSSLEFSIRSMRKEDIATCVDIWNDTGMQISLQSVYSWLKVDPEGFKVAVTNSGEIIGVCSAVVNQKDMAIMGMYVVKRNYQGKGIGFRVWNAAMEHVGERNACLDAVPDLRYKYQIRGGFPIPENEWVCLVYVSKTPVNPEALSDTVPDGVTIQEFEDSHLPLIYEFDKKLVGYERQLALELNCKEKEGRTLVALKDGICVGFGTIKPFGNDMLIVGPLYADDGSIAEVILRNLILCFPNEKGFAMITFSDNSISTDFMKRIGLEPICENYRLYRKERHDIDHSKLFAMFDINFTPH